jgi:hypothetical protein
VVLEVTVCVVARERRGLEEAIKEARHQIGTIRAESFNYQAWALKTSVKTKERFDPSTVEKPERKK